MPSYHCRWPTCPDLLKQPGYCQKHAQHNPDLDAKHAANKRYDERQRDPEAKQFYNSLAWRSTRANKLAADPICEMCTFAIATEVHHRVPLRSPQGWDKRLDHDNLQSACKPCHVRHEQRVRTKRKV